MVENKRRGDATRVYMQQHQQQQQQILTEHLTYTPLSFVDDVINAVNTLLYQAVEALEQFLTNGSNAQGDEIALGIHQLETLLENAVDRNFDKFELYVLRNVFAMPQDLEPYFLLQHHHGIAFDKLDGEADMSIKVHDARQKLLATQKLNRVLRAQERSNARLQQVLQMYTERVAYLIKANNLGESMNFFTAQVGSLRKVAALLKQVRAFTPQPNERHVFIEGMVRQGVATLGTAKDSAAAGEDNTKNVDALDQLA